LSFVSTWLRVHGGSIAVLGGEAEERSAVDRSLTVLRRWREILGQTIRTTIVSQISGYLAPVLPTILCAPKFLAASMTLGEVMQAASAFTIVQGTFNSIGWSTITRALPTGRRRPVAWRRSWSLSTAWRTQNIASTGSSAAEQGARHCGWATIAGLRPGGKGRVEVEAGPRPRVRRTTHRRRILSAQCRQWRPGSAPPYRHSRSGWPDGLRKP
jgi:hypothetical protein